MGHGTSGVDRRCAPTDATDQFGNAPYLADLVRRGFAVVLPNYQGLGGEGLHPYLDSTSEGLDVLGSVRAARALPIRFTPDTVLYGNSQGGRATEAAAELAPTRAPELRFAGNALVSPALRLDILAQIDQGRMSLPQYSVMPMVVRGAQAVDPSIRTEAVLRGPILAQHDALLSCTARTPATLDLSSVTADDVRPEPGTRARLAAFFDRNQLPRQANRSVPALVVYGKSDDLVLPQWTRRGIADLCRAGVPVQVAARTGGHTDKRDIATVGDWIGDRFAGRPVAPNCAA
ncbi:alpha/beta fold hydrolase [Tsukamurella strandjordii]|uniref:alpha/beta fold hydrolase n=2 Tax=Tsukamurella TaxID=2060 RepID=UPI0039EF6E7B